MTEPQRLLEARGVTRRFGAHVALAPTDLTIAAGDAIVLLGPNGAGKSTLLALLAGALEPTAGRIEQREGVRVGWSPQRPGVYGRLTPRENLSFFARLASARDGVESALPDRPAAELSVGERQRLNLAIAFIGDPHVVLLDEPTASLDASRRERLWRDLASVRERGGAFVFATQNLEDLDAVEARVIELESGRVRA